ncbi:MAG: ABC transporter ATP-binding protein/permease [Acidobacteriota bacterium]|nr:ABC transporter ATP-binding protein/permease [Acidobacteriota bacterium]
MTATALASAIWPLERLGEAIELLSRRAGGRIAQRAGFEAGVGEVSPPPLSLGEDDRGLDRWIRAVAGRRGLSVEETETTWGDAETFVRRTAPALLRLGRGGETSFLVLEKLRGRNRVALAAPDGRRVMVGARQIAEVLRQGSDAEKEREVETILEAAGVAARRRARVREALLAQRLEKTPLGPAWLLEPEPGASFARQLARAGIPVLVGNIVLAHVLQYVLLVLSWWVLGKGVLAGRLEPGWLLAWLALLLSMIPFVVWEFWLVVLVTTRGGALLRRRLFAGSLKLEPDEVRHQGAGQFLGRVIDAEAFESLALSGGRTGVIVVAELLIALPVLAVGAAGWAHAVLLPVWIVSTLWLWRRYLARRREWTSERLGMTHDLVEQMVGHRTRLAQQPPERWHEGEDQGVERYLDLSRAMDRSATALKTLPPRGWLLLAVLLLAPAFVAGSASIASVGISVGGILLVYRSLTKLVRGLADLASAMVAWGNVEPLFAAAGRAETLAAPEVAAAKPSDGGGPGTRRSPFLEAREVSFSYTGRADPVLRGCQLEVSKGDRLLVEGPSGSGKSTLAALLTGLRQPASGLLLLEGLDRQTLGSDGWRRRVSAAPQFHENHVLTDTLAFNLLMGRQWPPGRGDVPEAEEICRELGLGKLIERMPAGLQQMVGESGWQLSHGEKSRLYIARALLQKTDLVVLDESFAALDPENLQMALECVLRRAETVMVVAHP